MRALAGADAADDLAHLGHGVLQIGHRRQRRSIKRIFINEFADRALPARDLAGNAFNVGDGSADVAAVLFDEISQRTEQIVDGVGR